MSTSTTAFDPDEVLPQLTREEKAELVCGHDFWRLASVERLGVPRITVSDGPHGLRHQPEDLGDHLGLGGSVPATCFPTASALASSWDPALARRVGEALGAEARADHVSVVLGPGINMKRSPLCGRNFEYFSEDPCLAGELAVGMVEGIQSTGVGVSVKHFAANNQETDRLRVDAQVEERALREIYLPAFERVVTRAKPWTVMCSYNKINGVSSSENAWLLDGVLRGEWGFDGVVVSDWGATYRRIPALEAGLDLEMPANARSRDAVLAALDSGELDEAVLDRRVRAVLGLIAKGRHVLDLDEEFDAAAHHALARAAAADSAVLLTNDGVLPLAPETRVLLVGEFARTPRFQGAGSSQVNATRVDVIRDELERTFSRVDFAAGYTIEGDADADEPLRREAVAGAADADVVVLVLGLPPAWESEGYDRTHLDLPPTQLALLAALRDATPDIVTVLVNGSAVVVDDVVRGSRAVLETWLAGQAAGGALADLLSGAAAPSGRLAETIPHRLQDCPSYLTFPGEESRVRYGEGVFVGYRGYDAAGTDVAFPFGHGLTYTTFEYGDLRLSPRGSVAAGDFGVDVEVDVTNTGPRAGAEVVQVYVEDVESTLARPPRELKGFTKVRLEPGERAVARVALDQRAFAAWSQARGGWVVEAGEFAVVVGRDSRTVAARATLTVDAPTPTAPLDAMSTLAEWLADPRGGPALRATAKEAGQDLFDGGDADFLAMLENFPLLVFANLGQLPHAAVDELVAGIGGSAGTPQ